MTMHKKDRNIVRANSKYSSLDISFGPSDDDFHYHRHHGAISHEQEVVDANDLGVKLIFQGGCCEVAWATGDKATSETHYNGYVQIDSGGRLSTNFWKADEDGKQEEPFYFEFDDKGLRVYHYEGEPSAEDKDKCLVFDSATFRPNNDEMREIH